MDIIKIIFVSVLVILSLSGCDDTTKAYEKVKEQTIETSQAAAKKAIEAGQVAAARAAETSQVVARKAIETGEVTAAMAAETSQVVAKKAIETGQVITEISTETSQAVSRKAVEAGQMVTQKAEDVRGGIQEYSKQQVKYITDSIKEWIIDLLRPALPWIFLFSFFLMFGMLKLVVPFSNYAIIQLPIFIVSYGFIFSLFYKLSIAMFAVKATLWVMVPIAAISLVIFFSRDILLPRIKSWNDKLLNSKNSPESQSS